MKLAHAVFILIAFSFIGITLFGFTALGHENGHANNSGCIAIAMKGIDCPREINALAFLDFHFSALRIFYTAIIESPALATLLFLWFLAAWLAFRNALRTGVLIQRTGYQNRVTLFH